MDSNSSRIRIFLCANTDLFFKGGVSMDIFMQSSFSRSLANDLKMGAYYTDLNHSRRIGNLFRFPDEEVCVLEPCIGDAEAVLAVTGKKDNPKIKIFGVEINPVTCEDLEEQQKVDYLLNADFLNGVKISHNVFSFCFANPPYGVANDEKKRLETLFVNKIANYIATDGILALVIPYYVLTDENFLKTFYKWFQPIAEFRFDDEVYKYFKQICVIGLKRKSIGYLRSELNDYYSRIDSIDKLPYLPSLDDKEIKKINVLPSYEEKIEYFTTVEFNPSLAAEYLSRSPLYKAMLDKVFVKKYTATELGRPPVPLKKDLLYLVAISGGGQGLVGNEENGDLHLQRGVVKTVVTTETSPDNKEIIEKTRSKISLNIIENDGSVIVLE